MEQRKLEEIALHDRLRGDLREDPEFNSNKRFYSITESSQAFVYEWLFQRCRGKRVLDYCCGDGDMSVRLAAHGARVSGIDISGVSVANARRNAKASSDSSSASFAVMDAEQLAFAKDTFDIAIAQGVLHHLDLDRAYAEIARVLRPDGVVISTEALRHNVMIRAYRRLTPHLRTAWEAEHILGRREIRKAFEHFEEVRVERFFYLFAIAAVPFRRWPLFKPLLKLLGSLDRMVLAIPLVGWQAWMAVFTLSRPRKAGPPESSLSSEAR